MSTDCISIVLKLTGDEKNNIRGMRMDNDGEYVFSVYDFMTKAFAYKEGSSTARNEYTRLTKEGSPHRDEFVAAATTFKFPGGGQRFTPVMTVKGLLMLLNILDGKVASDFRKMARDIFMKVESGDLSLIEVIKANAASNEPLQMLCRESLAADVILWSGSALWIAMSTNGRWR